MRLGSGSLHHEYCAFVIQIYCAKDTRTETENSQNVRHVYCEHMMVYLQK